MNRMVVDCSVSSAWFLEDETSPAADSILDDVAVGEAVVPSLWVVEMADVLVAAERRGRIDPADDNVAVDLLARLPIRVEPADRGSMARVVGTCRDRGLSAYDASYLELAARLRLPLATLDHELARAARDAGVEVQGSARA